MPIEPPEMILSEDEDDYWGSFKGTATWQRKEVMRESAREGLGFAGEAFVHACVCPRARQRVRALPHGNVQKVE